MSQSQLSTQKWKIGIDCRLAGSDHAGIGRYVSNLVEQLLHMNASEKIEWVLFFHDRNQAQEVLPKDAIARVVFAPIRHYSLEEQLRMPAIFAEHHLDLLHVPHFNIPLFYHGKIIVTIHDLLWHEYRGTHVTTLPSWQYKLKHLAYQFTVSKAVQRAQTVIVPTETIKKTLIKYYPFAKNKVIITKEGVDPSFFVDHKTHGVDTKKYLVYVGSLYPHKNIEVVLQSLKDLPEYTLVLVGARNVFQEQVRARVKELGVTSQVTFVGRLSDTQLLETLDHAHALIQPSLFEGFGLTGVEAMAREVPVVASDIPIFKEVYQSAALFFNPSSSSDFVSKVKQLNDKDTVKIMVKKGREVAQQYRWDVMAQETLTQYLSILHEK